MNKTLVAYFSASGVTGSAARTLADALNADLYEIAPAVPYTDADLDWRNMNSRSSLEMKDKTSRPEIADTPVNIEDYDTILVGFPIWWYVAPTIVNAFLEKHDFSGKKIILFATSGGSGFGKTVESLKDSAPGAAIEEGMLQRGRQDMDAWKTWAKGLGL
ncbi:MAG: NAD(P)H-dependent oxidoreductase [Clostridia bacterium]|nr:NAD(P)H-dependent oxidoreductase [Clostridia bacterium]